MNTYHKLQENTFQRTDDFCEYCGKTFKSNRSLEIHQKRNCKGLTIRTLECKYACGYNTNRNYNLRRHYMQAHKEAHILP
ncbi:hypothetical protein WA026_023227 [Henosepilachna vigintioctopunctata]|uniref:C2H2-type domain-containing protein n=1 Tax=Henosepilachna vigintioctopunctata TaxID=420089 RepID=A0AAW1VC93_9CUCU